MSHVWSDGFIAITQILICCAQLKIIGMVRRRGAPPSVTIATRSEVDASVLGRVAKVAATVGRSGLTRT